MSTTQDSDHHLSPQFRKWDIARRREAISEILLPAGFSKESVERALGTDHDLIDLSDIMVESAIGYVALPLGVCRGLVVDGRTYDVPLVTEEPSVIAAATYASGIVGRSGGFVTWSDDPITTGQIFIEGATADAESAVIAAEPEIRAALAPIVANMEKRGGGYRAMDAVYLTESGLLRVQLHLDVRDAMGANLVNSAAESARPIVERVTGGRSLMAIVSNAAQRRLAGARFTVPVSVLSRSGSSGSDVARRIAMASDLAGEDPSRAVTHNKGVMNGITALMLATGNDTRAVEAAVHAHACRSGKYRGVATYRVVNDQLEGSIEIPLPVGSVGGAAGIHPTSRLALALLGNPTSTELARISAAVGLAQNLAAVSALVTEGIQRGHMALHARRLAWMAGARGEERIAVAQALTDSGSFNDAAASEALKSIRRGRSQ
jgi:hydroxymethylglutaryl-CoA reductase